MTKIITLIAALFFFITPAYATTDEVMLDMIEYIEENSKYEYNNEKLPYIQIRTMDELCQAVYPPGFYELVKDQCAVAGYYDHNLNTVFIADESGPYMVDEGFIETVLFHELVHYLQYLNGEHEMVQCQNALEADAFLLQDDYVQYKGYPEEQRPDPLFAAIVSSCNEDPFAP